MLAADWLSACYLESNHLFIIGSESSTTDNEADFFMCLSVNMNERIISSETHSPG